jgi:hypothetical protein
MQWPFKSNHKYQAYVKFFSQNRNAVWPGGGKAFNLDDYKEHIIGLNCRAGEKVCYGAWSGNVSWGAGRDGKAACSDCCRTCTHGRVKATVLGAGR